MSDSQQQLSVDEAYILATDHFKAERYSEADKLCTAVIKTAPNHIDAINLLGVIAQKINRHDLAVDLFQRAINIDNGIAVLYYNLGISLNKSGRKEDAVQALHSALNIEPENQHISNYINGILNSEITSIQDGTEEILQQGISAHQSGQLNRAMDLYKIVLEVQPENIVALSNFGTALQSLGALDEAVDIYQKVVAIKPDYPEALFNLGNILKDQNRLDEAVGSFIKAITIRTDYVEAYINLGHTLTEQGKLDEAVNSYQKAIAVNPGLTELYNNLGNTLKKQGKLNEAVVNFKKAVEINPNHAEAFFNLGNTLTEQNRLNDAIASYQKAIAIKPGYAKAYNNLGDAMQSQGDLDKAAANYQKAISIQPDNATTYCNLGNILKSQNRLDEAIFIFKKALSIKPDYADVYYNLGITLQEQNKLNDAITSYQLAIANNPKHAKAYNNLGNAQKNRLQLDDAVASYQKAVLIKPDYVQAYSNLGVALQEQGKLEESVIILKKAISINPDYAKAYFNLGVTSFEQGELNKVITYYKKAISIKPDYADAHSNLIFTLTLASGVTSKDILDTAIQWDKHCRLTETFAEHHNIPDPDRILRIGYVSPDLRVHPVAYLLEPLLLKHNSNKVETYCYAEVRQPDKVTKRFMAHANHWRSTVDLSNQQVTDMIRQDKIDILVDCGGHTRDSRLQVFTCKPAPIQISYLCMHGITSGASAMDYAISNELVIPQEFENQLSEKVIKIPETDIVFQPDPEWPLPYRNIPEVSDGIIFAVVGDPLRVDKTTIDLWEKLLTIVPGSRIIFKNIRYNSQSSRLMWQRFFNQLGEAATFEDIIGGWSKHKDFYSRVHVVLDTLPSTGTLSVLIPLWMGVPVVTMKSDFFAHRYGYAAVINAGFPELVADNPEEYLLIIKELVNDPQRMESLRHSMRNSIAKSRICNSKSLALNIEDTYRKVWKSWCDNKPDL
ncbi:MAG: tetratricopeptide repeat protein [Magnetococcales bacterium]|nr:tetratricopeptide repeat protein [Magnetococcales bacterium]